MKSVRISQLIVMMVLMIEQSAFGAEKKSALSDHSWLRHETKIVRQVKKEAGKRPQKPDKKTIAPKKKKDLAMSRPKSHGPKVSKIAKNDQQVAERVALKEQKAAERARRDAEKQRMDEERQAAHEAAQAEKEREKSMKREQAEADKRRKTDEKAVKKQQQAAERAQRDAEKQHKEEARRQEQAAAQAAKAREKEEKGEQAEAVKRQKEEERVAREEQEAAERAQRDAEKQQHDEARRQEQVVKERERAEKRKQAEERSSRKEQEREAQKEAERAQRETEKQQRIEAKEQRAEEALQHEEEQKRLRAVEKAQQKQQKEAEYLQNEKEKERKEEARRKDYEKAVEDRRQKHKAKRQTHDVAEQERLVKLNEKYAQKKFDHLYATPAWPTTMIPFDKKDFAQARVTYKGASQSYGSHGKISDLSQLVFGAEMFTFADVCLTANLIKEGVIESSDTINNDFLDFLKSEQFGYKSSFNEVRTEVTYVRHFKGEDIAIGVNVPVVYREQRLKFKTPFSDPDNNFNNQGDFPGAYSLKSFEGVVNDLLNFNGVYFNRRETRVGVGDLELFGTIQLYSRRIQRAYLGAKVSFPTAQNRDTTKLWPVELGNGGYPSVSAYVSGIAAVTRFINPNLFFQATCYLPTTMLRRIPKNRAASSGADFTETDATTNITPKDFLYGFGYLANSVAQEAYDQVDTTIPAFAKESTRIKMNMFPEFFLQLGNTCEKFLFRNAFLDVYYSLRVKGKDSVNRDLPPGVWNTDYLLLRTAQVEQQVGLQLSYQIDDTVRLKVDGQYAFAGRHVPRTYQAGVAVSADF